MYSGIAGALSNSTVNLMDRRLFLARLAALGGAAVSVPGLNVFAAAEAPRNTAAQVPGGRGKVQQVRGEIREYKDPKTGARVRRLTGDGSSNVHPYFTSWAFVGDDADNTVFVSNRSGAFLSSDDKEGGKYLGLMTHANGRVQIRRLAWHGTSGLTQASHGHPSFSPDDRWVIYNSDVEKCDNVYMADVQSL